MIRIGAIVLALVAMCSALSSTTLADDKKDEKAKGPTGTWLREANGLDLKLEFVDKDTFKLYAFGGDNGVITTNKFTFDKNSVLKATITKVEEKGDFPAKPPVGLEFSFKWTAKSGVGTLEDLKGEGIENAKPVLEGDYELKKEKK